MKIMTWNINSVRLRMPLLLRLLAENAPDIVCLQETKCPDDVFPFAPLQDAGYAHTHINGMKSYNGVAILSKHPISVPNKIIHTDRDDCRHIHATVNGTTVHSIYIPAGGDIPDRAQNDKYGHKLDFVDSLTTHFKAPQFNQVLLGDFNIAPLEHDVWSHKQLKDVVSHTEPEISRLNSFKDTGKFIDVARHFIPETEKSYTWWSYRNRDWQASNRGRRLDHIWVSPDLKPKLSSYKTLQDTRNWEQTSDHIPVILELN